MKKVILVGLFIVMFGSVNAGWESGCGKVEESMDEISIQMENWYNTFPVECEGKDVDLKWVDTYSDCDTDASYLADPNK